MQGNVRKQKHNETKDDRKDCTIVDERAKNNAEKEKRLKEKVQTEISNEALREVTKNHYTKPKVEYHAVVRKEKTRSWKEYCTTTTPTNPWNEVYKLAFNKTRSRSKITTLHTRTKPKSKA